MRSAELAETALCMRNIAFHEDDPWTTFEVIENGELGRVTIAQWVLSSLTILKISFTR